MNKKTCVLQFKIFIVCLILPFSLSAKTNAGTESGKIKVNSNIERSETHTILSKRDDRSSNNKEGSNKKERNEKEHHENEFKYDEDHHHHSVSPS